MAIFDKKKKKKSCFDTHNENIRELSTVVSVIRPERRLLLLRLSLEVLELFHRLDGDVVADEGRLLLRLLLDDVVDRGLLGLPLLLRENLLLAVARSLLLLEVPLQAVTVGHLLLLERLVVYTLLNWGVLGLELGLLLGGRPLPVVRLPV